jgi:hypothetical protein
MREDPHCYICGDCWWRDCPEDATHTIDAEIHKNGRKVFDGKVELCEAHAQLAHLNGGRLSLRPEALDQANELQTLARVRARERASRR